MSKVADAFRRPSVLIETPENVFYVFLRLPIVSWKISNHTDFVPLWVLFLEIMDKTM